MICDVHRRPFLDERFVGHHVLKGKKILCNSECSKLFGGEVMNANSINPLHTLYVIQSMELICVHDFEYTLLGLEEE